jgi:hypothetical protein
MPMVFRGQHRSIDFVSGAFCNMNWCNDLDVIECPTKHTWNPTPTNVYSSVSFPFQAQLIVEMYNEDQRHFNLSVPGFFSEFPRTMLQRNTVIAETEPGAVFYNLSVPWMETVRQAYKVHLTPLKCEGTYVQLFKYSFQRGSSEIYKLLKLQ